MRTHIRIGGKLIQPLGYSRETLPDLDPKSAFLSKLKNRLKCLGDLSEGKPEEFRRRIRNVNVNFYQGQNRDWVVIGIDRQEAKKDGWLWVHDGRGNLVHTGSGHSHNVAESGQVELPRFPAHAMALQALLSLPFEPRYDTVFTPNPPSVSSEQERRQIEIVEALTFYARHKFSDAVQPAVWFLRKMITESFNRSDKVDDVLVNELLMLLQEKQPDKHLIRFLSKFVRMVLDKYRPSGGEDLGKFGHNHSNVVSAMLHMVETIHKVTMEYLHKQSKEVQDDLIDPYKTVKHFNGAIQVVLKRFYDSEYHTVQNQIIACTLDVVGRSTADVLSNSGILESMRTFYKGNYLTLPQEQKTQIFQTIDLAASKSDAMRTNLLETWNRKVPHLGRQRPLWATAIDDDAIAKIVKKIPRNRQLAQSEFRFLASVASEAGASGNNLPLARSAQQQLLKAILSGQFDPSLRQQYIKSLESSANNTKYPVMKRELILSAKRLDVPR